jgi:hypothetical protein
MTWAQTQAAAVGSQRLTAWATARPRRQVHMVHVNWYTEFSMSWSVRAYLLQGTPSYTVNGLENLLIHMSSFFVRRSSVYCITPPAAYTVRSTVEETGQGAWSRNNICRGSPLLTADSEGISDTTALETSHPLYARPNSGTVRAFISAVDSFRYRQLTAVIRDKCCSGFTLLARFPPWLNALYNCLQACLLTCYRCTKNQ